jgi:hypothetical protein
VIAWLAALLLTCPPTTNAPPSDPHFVASPWGWVIHDEIAQPPLVELDPGTLPVWDVEASLAALGSSADERWIRWALTEASGKRETAHALLVANLAGAELSAERMAWWLAHAPDNGDARDALIDAHDHAMEPRTLLLLELGLALLYWETSCPVAPAPDGACRMPGVSPGEARDVLIRRDGIAVELAEHWTRAARRRVRRTQVDPADLTLVALLGQLELAASNSDYEAMLVARAPEGHSIWAWDSNDLKAENERVRSFYASHIACLRELFDGLDRVETSSPEVALNVLLRRAKLLLAAAETFDLEPRGRRDRARNRAETHEFPRGCVLLETRWSLIEQAHELARQCVEIATTTGGPGKLREACETVLEDEWSDDRVPLTEFVPEPGASVRMLSVGVGGL